MPSRCLSARCSPACNDFKLKSQKHSSSFFVPKFFSLKFSTLFSTFHQKISYPSQLELYFDSFADIFLHTHRSTLFPIPMHSLSDLLSFPVHFAPSFPTPKTLFTGQPSWEIMFLILFLVLSLDRSAISNAFANRHLFSSMSKSEQSDF